MFDEARTGATFRKCPTALAFPRLLLAWNEVGPGARVVGAVTGSETAAGLEETRRWWAARWAARRRPAWCVGPLRLRADEGVACRVPAVGAATGTAGFGFALETARTGSLTAVTTSPATSLSAGSTPEECAGTPPPGNRSSDRQIAAAVNAAGR